MWTLFYEVEVGGNIHACARVYFHMWKFKEDANDYNLSQKIITIPVRKADKQILAGGLKKLQNYTQWYEIKN